MAQSLEEAQAAYNRGDYAMALRGFRRLAEQGHAKAQFLLGFMYDRGKGVPQHFLRAHVWINLAASRLTGEQHEVAVELRDSIEKRLLKSELGRAQRMAEEWRAKTENE